MFCFCSNSALSPSSSSSPAPPDFTGGKMLPCPNPKMLPPVFLNNPYEEFLKRPSEESFLAKMPVLAAENPLPLKRFGALRLVAARLALKSGLSAVAGLEKRFELLNNPTPLFLKRFWKSRPLLSSFFSDGSGCLTSASSFLTLTMLNGRISTS